MGDKKQVDIYVVKTGKGYVVRPAAAAVSRSGGSLRFVNLTKAPALVHLAARELGRWEKIIVVPPQNGGRCEPIPIPKDAPYGAYAYSVYSEEAHDYCQGESSPIIIIDD